MLAKMDPRIEKVLRPYLSKSYIELMANDFIDNYDYNISYVAQVEEQVKYFTAELIRTDFVLSELNLTKEARSMILDDDLHGFNDLNDLTQLAKIN